MEAHLYPIRIALITFPIIAFLGTIPFLLYQYIKYHYVNKIRVLITYSLCLYCLTAYYMVILPLPKSSDVLSLYPAGRQMYQLVPFKFIQDILKDTQVIYNKPATYIHLFKEKAFLQAAFNVLLLAPLGIYLRYYFRKSWIKTVIIGFTVSLFFELTQLTGLYGFYNAPYRLFDVDDLILNTTGCLLGYVIAPLFTFFLPSSNKLDKDVDFDKMQVGLIRRGLAFIIDWCIISILSNTQSLIEYFFIVFIYFIVGVYITNGRTIGKLLTSVRVRGKTEKISFKEVLFRYGILYYGIVGANLVVLYVSQGLVTFQILILGGVFVIDVVVAISFFVSIIKRERQFFYEKISGTKNVISYKKDKVINENKNTL
ncbi:VanZ family protein [Vallitalea guaymasensis]|uniref:VanZ family protein n=1 Tax=Vallitalea guaymasensis TaxID=1185412 RepID=UPI002353E8EB|nr:VanZ family protein [Vallitalea guaymasensis]